MSGQNNHLSIKSPAPQFLSITPHYAHPPTCQFANFKISLTGVILGSSSPPHSCATSLSLYILPLVPPFFSNCNQKAIITTKEPMVVKAKAMAAGLRRSLSFSTSNPSRPSNSIKPLHVRSVSLPCRSHPLIPRLKDQLSHLRAWANVGLAQSPRNTAWICDGLAQLKAAHESLDDILQLPQAQDSRSFGSDSDPFFENLLEGFLRFVDAYGIFRATILNLKQHHLAGQIAARKRDEAAMASYAKSQRKFSNEMKKLAAEIGSIPATVAGSDSGGDGGEIVRVVGEVVEATVVVSLALFNGVAATSSSFKRRLGWNFGKKARAVSGEGGIEEFQKRWCRGELRKKGEEEVRMVLEGMRDLEGCIEGIEIGSEKVFRSLIHTRVSLLNLLTN